MLILIDNKTCIGVDASNIMLAHDSDNDFVFIYSENNIVRLKSDDASTIYSTILTGLQNSSVYIDLSGYDIEALLRNELDK
jgi:hypothetical protein